MVRQGKVSKEKCEDKKAEQEKLNMIGFIYDRKDKCTQFDDEVMGTNCGINGRNEEVERFWVWCGVVGVDHYHDLLLERGLQRRL